MSGEALEQVAGYRKFRDELDRKEANGTDYRRHTDSVLPTVDQFHPDLLKLTVVQITDETSTTKTFRMSAENRDLPPFEAGQYVNLYVEINGATTSRPLAISSAPQQLAYYDLTIKRLSGGLVSNYLLDEIVVGDTLESTSPMGSFHHNPLWQGDDLVFLAGGSGIAPAMSMIRDMIARNAQRRFHLIYGSQNEDDIIFAAELAELSGEVPDVPIQDVDHPQPDEPESGRPGESGSPRQWELTVTSVVSDPDGNYQGRQGFIDAALISEIVAEPLNRTFFICGPPAMYDFCLPEVLKLGVPRRRVRLEANGAPVNPTGRADWTSGIGADDRFTVTLPDGRRIEASATTPLLDTLEGSNAGFTLAACRSGECSLCRLKLVAGTVYEPAEAKVRRSDRDQGYVHSCVSYPTSDLTLDY
jgi:ferredoxin-NADP reductase